MMEWVWLNFALLVGRIVLVLVVLTVAAIIIGVFVIGCQVVWKGAGDAKRAIKATRKGK